MAYQQKMSSRLAQRVEELRFKPGILDEFMSAVDLIPEKHSVVFLEMRGAGLDFTPIKKAADVNACNEFLSTVKGTVHLFKELMKTIKDDELFIPHPKIHEVLRILRISPCNGEYFVFCSTVRDHGGFVFYVTAANESVIIICPHNTTAEHPVFTDYIAPRSKKYKYDRVCANCAFFLLKSETRRCGRCMARIYCSTECQHADWPKHKADCGEKARS